MLIALTRRTAAALLSLLLALSGLGFDLVTAPAASAAPAAVTSLDFEFLRATNARRAAAGVAPLQMSPTTADIALEWSGSMARASSLSHRPDLASQITNRVTTAWRAIAENVGVGYDVAGLDQAFFNSSGHRANLLNPRYRYVGIGTVRSGDGRLWVTFNFIDVPGLATVSETPPAPSDPSPAVVYTTSGEEVFRRMPDATIAGKRGSAAWSDLGGRTTAAPDAATWGGDRVDLVVRGTDGALWHRWHEGGHWGAWESLGGQIVGAPSVISWSPGRLDVFAIGTDGGLWHRWYEGGWHPWEPLGGRLTSAPDATSWAPGRLDVVARGGDSAVWHLFFDGGRWRSWSSLGGATETGPAAAGFQGALDVIVRGTDGQGYARRWNGWAWEPWTPLGGVLVGDVDAAMTKAGAVNVVVAGGDARLWSRSRDPLKGWLGWLPVG